MYAIFVFIKCRLKEITCTARFCWNFRPACYNCM